MQLRFGCCITFKQGDIIVEIVHHALPIPVMPSAVRRVRAGLMMEIQVAVLPRTIKKVIILVSEIQDKRVCYPQTANFKAKLEYSVPSLSQQQLLWVQTGLYFIRM